MASKAKELKRSFVSGAQEESTPKRQCPLRTLLPANPWRPFAIRGKEKLIKMRKTKSAPPSSGTDNTPIGLRRPCSVSSMEAMFASSTEFGSRTQSAESSNGTLYHMKDGSSWIPSFEATAAGLAAQFLEVPMSPRIGSEELSSPYQLRKTINHWQLGIRRKNLVPQVFRDARRQTDPELYARRRRSNTLELQRRSILVQ